MIILNFVTKIRWHVDIHCLNAGEGLKCTADLKQLRRDSGVLTPGEVENHVTLHLGSCGAVVRIY